MAVFGIGIDLVKVDRMEKGLRRWGERLRERIFTAAELADCEKRSNPAPCLALRFSAKEAFTKALGTGIRKPVRWKDVEVRPDPLGKPVIYLSERAEEFCRSKGIRSWHLSLTDDGEYGAAVVVIET